MAHHGIRRYQRFMKEVGRERGCGAAFPGGGDLGLQGQGMENSATGVGGTDAKPGGITLF
jgi:hypothetical protein